MLPERAPAQVAEDCPLSLPVQNAPGCPCGNSNVFAGADWDSWMPEIMSMYSILSKHFVLVKNYNLMSGIHIIALTSTKNTYVEVGIQMFIGPRLDHLNACKFHCKLIAFKIERIRV